MKHDTRAAQLIVELESYIGGTCYNPRSYNGWTKETGCYFSYPAHFYKEPNSCTWFEYAMSMHYRFGANHLRVGQSILDLLEHLEDRYGLDISALEVEYQLREEQKRETIEANERLQDKICDAFALRGYDTLRSGDYEENTFLIFIPAIIASCCTGRL